MKAKIFLIASGVFLAGAVAAVIIIKFNGGKIVRPLSGESLSLVLVSELNSSGLSISGFPYEDNEAIVSSISGVLVYFSKDKDFKSQVTALQLILGKTTVDAKVPKEVDLRYNKPVLRY